MLKLRKITKVRSSDIDDPNIVGEFVKTANKGLSSKEEIIDKYQLVNTKIDVLNHKLDKLGDVLQNWEGISEAGNSKRDQHSVEEYGTKEEADTIYEALKKERAQWKSYFTQLESLILERKNFNKIICLSNIRELLRHNLDVKIGQIEKEAGIRLGYMSRLEKEGNTSEPSVEFIATAAKLLKVSIDTLVSVDLTGLTPTEQYIVKFFDKLKADTLQEKLDWNRETSFDLNKMESYINDNVEHPMFSVETFYEATEMEYPGEITRTVFNSKTFGPHTFICGDCFNLKLKNGTTLYLMDIEKSVHRNGDRSAFAKEAWMCVPNKERQILVASQDDTPVAPLLEVLFSTVKERMEHPKVNTDVMKAIDAFMVDDLEDDDTDDVPF